MVVAAELFADDHPNTRIQLAISGTGGGFKKFLAKDPTRRTDINCASRPIKPREIQQAKEVGVAFIELPIAHDGIAVVVHPSNTFCKELSTDELRRIWQPGSTVRTWKDVRPGFPDRPLHLYGPGTDSGTFDYFIETIVGKASTSRSDFAGSEDDNVIVRSVAGDPGALGYFGYTYFETNKDKLRLVAIRHGTGTAVLPDLAAIRDGRYAPLARPLFLYVSAEAARRAEVRDFVAFFLKRAHEILSRPDLGYVALDRSLYEVARNRLDKGTTGSVFARPDAKGMSLAERFAAKCATSRASNAAPGPQQ
jgi:phosphate transport system substrate-binding protein